MYTYNENGQKVPIKEEFTPPKNVVRENYSSGSKKSHTVWIVAGIVGLVLLLLAIYFLFMKKKSASMGFRKQRFGFTFY